MNNENEKIAQELSDFQTLYLKTYDAVKAAKIGGIKLEQMIRLMENMYHVALDPITIPDVFYYNEEKMKLLNREIAKSEELVKETEELLEEKEQLGYEQDEIAMSKTEEKFFGTKN